MKTVATAQKSSKSWETWFAAERSAQMSDLWIEDDLEKTPLAQITVLEEPFELLPTTRSKLKRKSRSR